MQLQHIFRAYARRIGIDGQRESALDLYFTSIGGGRADGIGNSSFSLSFSLFVSHAFSLLRRPRASRASSPVVRGVIHLSASPTPQPPRSSVLPTMRIRIRRPDAWRTAISLCHSLSCSSFSPPPHSSDTCAKSGVGEAYYTVSVVIHDEATRCIY